MRRRRAALGLALCFSVVACARENPSASVASSGAESAPASVPSTASVGGPASSSSAPSSGGSSSSAPSTNPAPSGPRSARLVRSGPLGIPVHAEPRDRTDFHRAADGTRVEATPVPSSPNWLRVAFADGRVGFVVRRYVAFDSDSVAQTASSSGDSREECERSLVGRPRGTEALVGTFNVRWFPDGGRGTKSEGSPTDLEWLACAILRTEASVVALEEWASSPRAEAATKRLLARLEERTKTPWKLVLDECREGGAQQVGLLWNTGEASLDDFRTLASLNPHGRACEQKNRPGLSARVTLGARRFEFVAVHFKSGVDARSLSMRDRSFLALVEHAKNTEGPLVVAGDFNTMGCEECSPAVSAEDERRSRDSLIGAAGGEFLPDAPSCSHYYRDAPGLLDGFATFRLVPGAISVGGECARAACRVTEGGAFHRSVSDHCPLALSLGVP